jgi:prepilin-type N-terminal cleavage/methylation domain-containing protein
MKKPAFTLTELIIAITIIGVAAALALPSMISIMPDGKKMKVIKYYNIINNTVEEILANPDLYHPYWGYDGNYEPCLKVGNEECVGLECVDLAIEGVVANKKVVETILSDKLAFDEIDLSIYQKPNQKDVYYNIKISIKEKDTEEECSSSDINGDNCKDFKDVNTFKFVITKEGDVIPAENDYLLQAYLLDPHNTKDRKKDFEVAKELKGNQ